MRFFCAAVVLFSAGTIRAQDDSEALAKKAYEMAAVEAKSLVLQLDSKDLKLESRSLMRWSNPLSGQVYGDVYIWTLDGRPEAIASIFKWFSPNTHLSTELQSLSESPLVATKGNQQVWNPTPGLEMELLPSAAAPRTREFQRLQQMRAILGEFKAEAVDRKDDNKTWFLRPLAKPVFRYSSEARNIVDGALFAFCQENTNNPEIILVIEAREKDNATRWYHAFARQNSVQMRVYRKDALVWEVLKLAPPWENIKNPDKPYINLTTLDP